MKRSRRRVIRYSILLANVLVLVSVLFFVVKSPASNATSNSATLANSNDAAANPLDQISSADIAVNIARMARMDEAVAVVNNADSVNSQLTLATGENTVINKPQVVNTALRSNKDIQRYVVVAGDTVATLATKFNVTSDSLRWSNGISGNALTPGKELLILPGVNGIIYKVAVGDTPESLSARFQGNRDQIVAYNDAEVSGLPVGQYVIIPNGLPLTARATTSLSSASSGFAWGSSAIYGYNGYDPGWCTWYAASKVAVPSNWGNANTWDDGGRASGWIVSSTPKPGAIAQNNYPGVGHVAVVEAVSEDGMMIKYSDMNGLAGWGRVGYSDWVSVSKFQNYIYH